MLKVIVNEKEYCYKNEELKKSVIRHVLSCTGYVESYKIVNKNLFSIVPSELKRMSENKINIKLGRGEALLEAYKMSLEIEEILKNNEAVFKI